MKRKLSPWCKEVKKTLIDRDMSVTMDNKLSAPSRTMHWVDRNKIKPNDYNPNKVSRQNLELLTQSIFTNGWTLPIVVRPDGTIIDGFHRWTVAGPDWKYVPPSEEDDRRTLFLGVSAGLADTVNTYKGFESMMSQVQAISGATGKEFDDLTAKAQEMGATTKFTATEAAQAFNYMAMAGWKPEQMTAGISGIMSLAAASGEDLASTSDIVTDALTAFGLKAKDAGHFSDVLAKASASSNTNVGMLGESFKYVAPVAGAMKYSVEDTSLALGLMANSSIKGSMAGTALKTSLANMAAPTNSMAEAMDKYGISLTDGSGNMKTLKGVMDNLRSSLGGLSETEQTAAASTIFGKEAMSGMLAIINASEQDYNDLSNAIGNSKDAAQDMADTMLDNLAGSMTLMQSAVEGTQNSFGQRLTPYVRGFVDSITDAMPAVTVALNDFMDTVDKKAAHMKTVKPTTTCPKGNAMEIAPI